MQDRGKLHEDDLISQAWVDLGAWHVVDLIGALEAFHGSGFSDQSSGDVEAPTGHFYRVHRWIVRTDTQGFRDVETFDTESEARERFDSLEDDFSGWGE